MKMLASFERHQFIELYLFLKQRHTMHAGPMTFLYFVKILFTPFRFAKLFKATRIYQESHRPYNHRSALP